MMIPQRHRALILSHGEGQRCSRHSPRKRAKNVRKESGETMILKIRMMTRRGVMRMSQKSKMIMATQFGLKTQLSEHVRRLARVAKSTRIWSVRASKAWYQTTTKASLMLTCNDDSSCPI